MVETTISQPQPVTTGKEQGSTNNAESKKEETISAHALLFSVKVCLVVEMTRSRGQFLLLVGRHGWVFVNCEALVAS
jgi:hypothetical protein